MREIEFRGKKTSDGTWVEGYYMHHISSVYIGESGSFHAIHTRPIDPESGERVVEVSPETVGQFTGLHDSAGNKVFEGDIVRLFDEDAVIKWDDTLTRFVAVWRGHITDYYDCYDTTGEVIGNIHDDPELLEVVK